MMRVLLASAALALALGGAAQATVIFSDNFDGEALGAPQPNLTNWNVTSGTVDVIGQPGFFEFYPGNGRYIDLNGSPGAGRIETKNPLALIAGKRYAISFDYGNNKNSNNVEQLSFGIDGKTWVIDIPGAIPDLIAAARTFVYGGGSATLFFADTGLASPKDNGGPILDNVKVALVPLPAGGLMLLAGFGGLALLRRRKAAA